MTPQGQPYIGAAPFADTASVNNAVTTLGTKATPIFTQTAIKTISATTATTTFYGTGTGSKTLPANFFTAGKTLRITTKGVYSTPALITTANLNITISLGGVVIATGTTSSLIGSATNAGFSSSFYLLCIGVGSSGSFIGVGDVSYAVAGVGIGTMFLNNGTSPVPINTTIPLLYDATVTYSNNNAGNSISNLYTIVESLN